MKHLPKAVLLKASMQRAAGAPWQKIAAELCLSTDTIRRRIDPGYSHMRTQEQYRRRLKDAETDGPILHSKDRRIPAHEIEAALSSVPPDTRGLTARLLGDPLPGRSALDQWKGLAH